MPDPIIEFQDVTVEGGHQYDTGIWGVNFALAAGELMIVHLERGHPRVPLADAAQGIVVPGEGRVLFQRQRWRDRHHDELFATRQQIGRVFDEPGWLTELDVDDNVTLVQRHYTHRSDREILDEAS